MEVFDIRLFEENYHSGGCRYEKDGYAVTMSEWEDCYETLMVPVSEVDMVCVQKLYYIDTLTLMSEGLFLKLGNAKIEVWKEFDKEGNLIQEIDYEKGWGFGWDKLFPRLMHLEIDMKKVVRISRTIEAEIENNDVEYDAADFIEKDLFDKVDNKQLLRNWKISILLSPDVKEIVYFDGETGNRLWSEYVFKED